MSTGLYRYVGKQGEQLIMREHKVKLEESKRDRTSSSGEETTQIGLVLQIYQDLLKLDSQEQEDELILDILEQILLEYFPSKEDIPVPPEYREEETKEINYYNDGDKQ